MAHPDAFCGRMRFYLNMRVGEGNDGQPKLGNHSCFNAQFKLSPNPSVFCENASPVREFVHFCFWKACCGTQSQDILSRTAIYMRALANNHIIEGCGCATLARHGGDFMRCHVMVGVV